MSRRPLKKTATVSDTRIFPYLRGLSAQRVIELVALQLAPAVAAAAVASSRVDSGWETLLVFVSVVTMGGLLRQPRYPLHLVPFASAVLYLLAAPLGALAAIAVSRLDGYGSSEITASQMVAPVLAAWLVTAVGALVNRRFRREREVRIGVIGSHEFAAGLIAELEAVKVRGYRVVGCIDPEKACPTPDVAGVPCLGSLVWVRSAILKRGIELLVLGPVGSAVSDPESGEFPASGVSRLDVFERVADACLDLPVSMIDAGQLYEELFGHVPLGTTTSAWFQYLLHPRYRAAGPTSKRMLDIGLGLLATVIALPLLAVGAVLIKLTDRGPILHRQKRIGAGGGEIELVKLRTMRIDVEGPSWTEEDDGRITLVGRVLRRTHIDELPQLWLVLKGEMSLVGPRPEQQAIVSDLEARFSHYDRRHLVKPGITGWAQVRCGYAGSHIGTAWKLCHDLYYLKHRSLVFDLLIMLETATALALPDVVDRPDERFIVAARANSELPASLETI